MEAEFWKAKWDANDIGFHADATNPHLLAHFDALELDAGSRILLPLCGKTLDIAWLLSRGYRVAGIELVEPAVLQLFDELGVEPVVSEHGPVRRFAAGTLDIYAGDIFDVDAQLLGPVDAVYDRAALVALPENVRADYTAHLREISANAPQLLVAYVYDQALAAGPPFSVSDEEVSRHYAGHYRLQRLAAEPVPGGLKGKYPAEEHVWLLADV